MSSLSFISRHAAGAAASSSARAPGRTPAISGAVSWRPWSLAPGSSGACLLQLDHDHLRRRVADPLADVRLAGRVDHFAGPELARQHAAVGRHKPALERRERDDDESRVPVLVRKEQGRWKIAVDYDSSEGGTIDEASFRAAHAMDDYAKY